MYFMYNMNEGRWEDGRLQGSHILLLCEDGGFLLYIFLFFILLVFFWLLLILVNQEIYYGMGRDERDG